MSRAPAPREQVLVSQKPTRSWFSLFFQVTIISAILFLFIIYVGFEPKPTVIHTKLFPLFDSREYHDLEKQIDTKNRVLLIGDEEDGLGIFIDQYIHERNQQYNIKRRQYHYGKDLNYAHNNIFSKGYNYIINAISDLLKTKSQSQQTLWLIENDGALSIKDINFINEFVLTHPEDKFLVTAEVVPSKANKFFQIIDYHELPGQFVSEHFYKDHKLNRVTATNLLNAYGRDLSKINQFFEHQDVALKFSETYTLESEQLNELLLSNNKSIKAFFDKMCKNGFVKTKKQFDFIPENNNLVRYDKVEQQYEWKSIRGLFAFSGRFNIVCNANVDFQYVAPAPDADQFWVEYLSFIVESLGGSSNETDSSHALAVRQQNVKSGTDSQQTDAQQDEEKQVVQKKKQPKKTQKKQPKAPKKQETKKQSGNKVKKQSEKQVEKPKKSTKQQTVKDTKKSIKETLKKPIKAAEKVVKEIKQKVSNNQKPSKVTQKPHTSKKQQKQANVKQSNTNNKPNKSTQQNTKQNIKQQIKSEIKKQVKKQTKPVTKTQQIKVTIKQVPKKQQVKNNKNKNKK